MARLSFLALALAVLFLFATSARCAGGYHSNLKGKVQTKVAEVGAAVSTAKDAKEAKVTAVKTKIASKHSKGAPPPPLRR